MTSYRDQNPYLHGLQVRIQNAEAVLDRMCQWIAADDLFLHEALDCQKLLAIICEEIIAVAKTREGGE